MDFCSAFERELRQSGSGFTEVTQIKEWSIYLKVLFRQGKFKNPTINDNSLTVCLILAVMPPSMIKISLQGTNTSLIGFKNIY